MVMPEPYPAPCPVSSPVALTEPGRTLTAEARKVTQVAFKPDWTKHAKAAPFTRKDVMLDVLPVGVLVFPGNGNQENLADKAKKLGIPVLKFEKRA